MTFLYKYSSIVLSIPSSSCTMNSLSFLNSLSFFPSPPHRQIKPENVQIFPQRPRNPQPNSPLSLSYPYLPNKSLQIHCTSLDETKSPNEGQIPLVDLDELFEKDWSFLDSDDLVAGENYTRNIEKIIASGEVEETSRVLISASSEDFVDRFVEKSRCDVLVVAHDSLFVLAGIKERHDKVKCWQGELIYVPEKWAPLDVVFLYFLPGLPFGLDRVFDALAKSCLPGSRVVISHPQGREGLEQQRKDYPDVVVGDLPDKLTLEKVAKDHSFDLIQFVDDPAFYLVVFKYGRD